MNARGDTQLLKAVDTGDMAAVGRLLGRVDSDPARLLVQNMWNDTAMIRAAQNGNVPAIEALLAAAPSHYGTAMLLQSCALIGWTPLWRATHEGHVGAVEAILRAFRHPSVVLELLSARDRLGRSLISWAAWVTDQVPESQQANRPACADVLAAASWAIGRDPLSEVGEGWKARGFPRRP